MEPQREQRQRQAQHDRPIVVEGQEQDGRVQQVGQRHQQAQPRLPAPPRHQPEERQRPEPHQDALEQQQRQHARVRAVNERQDGPLERGEVGRPEDGRSLVLLRVEPGLGEDVAEPASVGQVEQVVVEVAQIVGPGRADALVLDPVGPGRGHGEQDDAGRERDLEPGRRSGRLGRPRHAEGDSQRRGHRGYPLPDRRAGRRQLYRPRPSPVKTAPFAE